LFVSAYVIQWEVSAFKPLENVDVAYRRHLLVGELALRYQ